MAMGRVPPSERTIAWSPQGAPFFHRARTAVNRSPSTDRTGNRRGPRPGSGGAAPGRAQSRFFGTSGTASSGSRRAPNASSGTAGATGATAATRR
nr:hypothetical protein KPHV_35540 [Kitasatospora purpeofusca]